MQTRNQTNRARGMSLIELIGVMAVLSILAAVLVPAFIRKLDQVAHDQESASLKALAESLQSSILRNRYIPSHTNWAQTVAVERGVNLTDVTTNLRRRTRVLWVDPLLQIGSRVAGQDYRQDVMGSVILGASGQVIPPVNPRLILLSSIGQALPAGVTNGVPASAADFDGVWNVREGALPAGSLWAGWGGAADLKVQRINLSPLFVHVVLTTYMSTNDGRFAIDGGMLTNAPATLSGRDTYFLQNSVLQLYSYTNSLDTVQILTRSISFVYQGNIWRASLEGLGSAGGMDIATIVDRFLRAPNNPRAVDPANQQAIVLQSMKDFITAYTNWEAQGWNNQTYRNIALATQSVMMNNVQGLYKNPGNDPSEVACP